MQNPVRIPYRCIRCFKKIKPQYVYCVECNNIIQFKKRNRELLAQQKAKADLERRIAAAEQAKQIWENLGASNA